VALLLAVLGAGAVVAAAAALRRGQPGALATRVLLALLFLALAALVATIAVATRGYQAFTREVIAATVEVTPTGRQRFTAVFEFPDGRRETFDLAGDQIYVDAHVLKWKPVANFFGLHTAYELDRIGGRYVGLEAERGSPRTVYAFGTDKPLNMFSLRQRWAFLAPLLDAEYGSGTFLMADRPVVLEVRVSTTGLLMRTRETPSR
jgi:hypothetical protein